MQIALRRMVASAVTANLSNKKSQSPFSGRHTWQDTNQKLIVSPCSPAEASQRPARQLVLNQKFVSRLNVTVSKLVHPQTFLLRLCVLYQNYLASLDVLRRRRS